MDPRIKKILEDSASKKRAKAKKLAEQKVKEEKEAAKKLKKQTAAAKVWVETHIFDLIKQAEDSNQDYVWLSDYRYKSDHPSYEGIPAYLLAEAARAIDGLRVETRFVKGYNDPDMGHEEDHHDYEIWWKPKPYSHY